MRRLSLIAVLALAAGTAACGRLGLSEQGPQTSAYEPLPGQPTGDVASQSLQPLPPPGPTVQSSTLPPAPGQAQPYPAAGQPQGYPPAGSSYPTAAAPAAAPVSADKARALSMSDLAGAWTLMSGADNCQVTMSLTAWAGGRRAMSRGCTSPDLQRISAWLIEGKQVVLKGSDGATVATLYSAQPEQFSGSTMARQPITLSR